MAQKVKSHLETEGYLTTKSRLIIEDAVFDNTLSSGTNGQVLSKNGSGQVVWADASGGTIDGSGTANKMAKWSDSDTLAASSYLNESGTGLQIGTDGLTYVHATKRVGISTTTPSVAFDCAGAAKFQSSFYDGSNNLAADGKVLTGTSLGECLWADAESIAFRDVVTYSESFKIGTSGTFYMDTTGQGTQFSINEFSTILVPYDGKPLKFIIRSTIAKTGFTMSLVDGSGTNIYTSGSINLSANTNYTLTPSSGTWSAGDRISVKIVRPTASNNGNFQITAVYAYDI